MIILYSVRRPRQGERIYAVMRPHKGKCEGTERWDLFQDL